MYLISKFVIKKIKKKELKIKIYTIIVNLIIQKIIN